MNGSVIGKIIYFWIFMLGGLFAAKMFGFADDAGSLIKVLILCGIVFFAFTFVMARAKAGSGGGSPAAASQTKNMGNNVKHKKKKGRR